MLDLHFVRDNLPLVEEKLRTRGLDPAVALADFTALDRDRREAITEAETLKAQRNRLSQEIAQQRRAGLDAEALTTQNRTLKTRLDDLETRAAAAETRLQTVLQSLPNLPLDDVPVGPSEHENRLEKTVGAPPLFDFPPRPHWEIGESLGIVDFERAAKVSGARFVVQIGAGARLERALAAFMLDIHTRPKENQGHGYLEILPPALVNSRSLFGTGQLPKFAADLFHCDDRGPFTPGDYADNDHWLIPTAEVPLTNLLRDETLDAAELPLRLCAWTPCFRSEAGSYGKDVRGMIRQHQFQKVELVSLCRPEDAAAEHEHLTRAAETVLERLELPYRRMLLSTGDMGFSAAKTYDLEVWLPGQNLYREISSCSDFGTFQARRANLRYRPAGQRKSEHLATLNGSGLAIGRTYLALLENCQQPDGTVRIPPALQPYMHGETHITPQPGLRPRANPARVPAPASAGGA